jgi:glyoxylase-like metal-dependent hydrolase (beta-lactamase superfamily II)
MIAAYSDVAVIDKHRQMVGRVTWVLLAGDTSYTEALMVAGKVDGVSPDATVSRATLSAIRRFTLERRTGYLPTHDPDSGARLAARQVVTNSIHSRPN